LTLQRIGPWLVVVFLWVELGRIQDMIPGLKYMKPGLLIQFALFLLVLANLHRLRINQPVLAWRFGFLLSIIPGLFLGYGTGRVRMIFQFEIERFLSGFMGILLLIRSLADLRRVHTALLYLALVLSVWTIAHGGHGPGLLGDENDIALFLVMLLPFAYMKSTLETKPLMKAFCLLIFLLTLMGIATTVSRGGMVGALPTLAFIWLKSKKKALSLVLFAIGIGLTVAFGPEKLVSEFKTIGDTQESTASSRIFFWGLSWELFKLHPFFGVGAECWGNAIWANIQSGAIQIGRKIGNMTPHSVYFQLIAEMGLLGTVMWTGFLAAFAGTLYRLRGTRLDSQLAAIIGNRPDSAVMPHALELLNQVKAACISLAICLLGFMLAGAFLSVLFYPMIYIFGALAQATKNVWDQELIILNLTKGKAAPPAAGIAPAAPAAPAPA
jgi:O-antigen ligase